MLVTILKMASLKCNSAYDRLPCLTLHLPKEITLATPQSIIVANVINAIKQMLSLLRI